MEKTTNDASSIIFKRILTPTSAALIVVSEMSMKKPVDDTMPVVRCQILPKCKHCANTIADVPCAQISSKDTKCICCQKPMQWASNFNKNHANCITRMADQLSETKRVEAIQQKRRINDKVTKLLYAKTERFRRTSHQKAVSATSTLDATGLRDAGSETCGSGRYWYICSLDETTDGTQPHWTLTQQHSILHSLRVRQVSLLGPA